MSENHKTLGILGGGQLARLLALRAQDLNITTYTLCQNKEEPAVEVTNHWIKGDLRQVEDVKKLVNCVDRVCFESEFIAKDVLNWLNDHCRNVFPKPEIMQKLADRASQKTLLEDFQVEQARFIVFDEHAQLLEKAKGFNLPLVIKKRKEGYDGKGTFICKNLKSSELKNFLASSKDGYIAEEFINFQRELAITLVRDSSGNTFSYPLVETKQQDFRCDWVKGPIEHSKIQPLKQKLIAILNAIDYIGVIAFELFEQDNGLLINEVAPRVHNSSHYTSDACHHDQFEAHIRAIFDLNEINTSLSTNAFAMANIIGTGKKDFSYTKPTVGTTYWYRKKENKLGRKMGHINLIANEPTNALKMALKAREGVIK